MGWRRWWRRPQWRSTRRRAPGEIARVEGELEAEGGGRVLNGEGVGGDDGGGDGGGVEGVVRAGGRAGGAIRRVVNGPTSACGPRKLAEDAIEVGGECSGRLGHEEDDRVALGEGVSVIAVLRCHPSVAADTVQLPLRIRIPHYISSPPQHLGCSPSDPTPGA